VITGRRLLVVEDEPLVAALLQDALTSSGFEVLTTNTAIEAKARAAVFDPDIAVLDINLGAGASGVDLAYVLNRTYPGIAIIFLTKHPDLRTAGFSNEDVPPGCGFIRKDQIRDSKSIVSAIEMVIASRPDTRQDADPSRPLGNLTGTQVDVLRLLALGYTNSEIAKRRKVSVRATEQVIETIYSSLGIDVSGPVNPRVEATRLFIDVAGKPERQ